MSATRPVAATRRGVTNTNTGGGGKGDDSIETTYSRRGPTRLLGFSFDLGRATCGSCILTLVQSLP